MADSQRIDDLGRPRLPWGIRALNFGLRPLNRRLAPLDFDALLEAARKREGLSDFGDDPQRRG